MKNWKFILVRILWLIASLLLIALFVIAWRGKSEKKCESIQIELTGESNGFLFMDEKEILQFINSKGVKVGVPLSEINLINLEKELNDIKWVEHTNIYFDNLQQLQVKIQQRVPVARIFTIAGNSFYIDKTATRLPLRQLSIIRLPIFTGFPTEQEKLSKPDSVLLNDILHFALTIKQDSFFLAQMAQINIAPNGDFEMIPALGDHTVLFGSVENLEDKLNRLYTFYKNVWPSSGINAYQVLDLRFDHQLLALKKGLQPIQYLPGSFPDLKPSNILDSTSVSDTVMAKQTVLKDSTVILKDTLKKQSSKQKVSTPKTNLNDKRKTNKNAIKLNNKSPKNTLKQEKKSAKAEMPKKTSSNNN